MRITTVALRSSRVPGDPPDLDLSATLYLSDPPASAPVPGLIVGHGAGSRGARHDEFCRYACSRTMAVLALDFRGHGKSGGVADGALEDDLRAAAQYLRGRPEVDPARILYRGSSMGGLLRPQGDFAPRRRFRGHRAALPGRRRGDAAGARPGE